MTRHALCTNLHWDEDQKQSKWRERKEVKSKLNSLKYKIEIKGENIGLISKTWSRDQVQLPLITPWSGALIIIKVVGSFCQRHNYKNPVEEGTQTNICWDLIYAGIGPITKGAVLRDDPYHHRHCASSPVATALHYSNDLHLHRRLSSSTSTANG